MRKAVIGIIGHMQGKLYDIGKNLYGILTPYEQVVIDPPTPVPHNKGLEKENHRSK